MLGGLRVFPTDNPDAVITRFATVKTASLLAYLACFPQRVHPREELIERFWPDSDLDAGRTSLRSALASLRRQLEPPGTPTGAVLVTDRQSVRLHPRSFTTDVAAFENAVAKGDYPAAHTLYRGELLPGFYDEWVLDERERLVAVHETLEEAEGIAPENAAPVRETVLLYAPEPRLPLTLTRFFGREKELLRLQDFLAPDSVNYRRLVTLTGPGGIGKTRLSIEVARGLASACGMAVFFVSLADLADPALLFGQIAQEIGVASEEEALAAIAKALSAFPMALLVLDNLEQLIEGGAASRVQMLLARVPGLSILVTSRRRLVVPGEREVPLEPLPAPLPEEEGDVARVAGYPSVSLFVDLAQAVRPDFQVTPRNAGTVAALCRALDGLPLALELVAARAHTLTPAQMLDGLDQRWELLSSRKRDKTERHRSLHTAISWSIALMPASLAAFWSRLSVFRGGCSPAAAAAITGEPYALEYLTQLRERSLVVTDEAAGEMRFRLLETLREFAAMQLEPEERETLSQRHAAFFRGRTEEALPHFQAAEAGRYLDRMEADKDNLRAALAWSREKGTPEALPIGLHIASDLWRYWEMRGYLTEGRGWLETLLANPAGKGTQDLERTRVRALNGVGMLAARQGDYEAAWAWHTECLNLSRAIDWEAHVAVSLGNLGLVAAAQWRYDDARALYEESLAKQRLLGDIYSIGLMLNNLGTLAYEQGDYAQARVYLEESLAVRRERGDTGGVASGLGNLGNLVYLMGDYPEARRLHEEGLVLLRDLGDKRGIAYALLNLGEMAAVNHDLPASRQYHAECLRLLEELGDRWALSFALDNVAGLAAGQKRWQQAAHLRGAAAALRTATGNSVPPPQREEYERAAAAVRTALGDLAFERAFAAGQELDRKAAVLLALQEVARR